MNPEGTYLLYRARCPRCRIIARSLHLAALGAVRLEPLDPGVADALAEATRSRAKLLVRDDMELRIGREAANAFLCAGLPRWLALSGALAVIALIYP